MALRTVLVPSWGDVDPTAWDSLVGEGSPFLEHAYLSALERSGVADGSSGWIPSPILVFRGATLVAGAPAWQVSHDDGQFVWMQHWQRALAPLGRTLEPRWIVGVPFTPVTGARLLLADPDDTAAAEALLVALDRASARTAGWHLLFPHASDATRATRAGAFVREQFQYHWIRESCASFEDYLAGLTHRRRKEVRRERAAVADLDRAWVPAPGAAALDVLARGHADTVARNGGGPVLPARFFQLLGETWSHRIALATAADAAGPLGAALFVEKGDRLYGRWAGQLRPRRFLHFELCTYQAIARCLDRGLAVFEPGHGGDHKLLRGLTPAVTRSAHRFHDPRVHRAFAAHAEEERRWMAEERAAAATRSSLRSEG